MQFTGLTPQVMLEQVKPQALKRIQSRLVLEAVVAAEGIAASEEDYQKEAEKMAEMYQMEVDKVKEMLEENASAKDQLMKDLAITKAVEFVVENAKEGAKKAAKKAKAEDAKEE